MIDAANKRAAQIVDEAKEQARTEGNRLKDAANAEIEQEKNRAREELRAQLSQLVIEGASKVLGQSVDTDTNRKLVDDLAKQL